MTNPSPFPYSIPPPSNSMHRCFMIPVGFIVLFLLSSLRIYTNCTLENRSVVLRMKPGETTIRLNKTLDSPVKSTVMPIQDEEVTIQPTVHISSDPINYANERPRIYPNFTVETSFQQYERRLSQTLQTYRIQEQNCYRSNHSNCLSFNKKETSVALKKYREEDLRLVVPSHVETVIESSDCGSTGYLVGIVTAPFQFAERYAIRRTGCNPRYSRFRCLFYAGYTYNQTMYNVFLKDEAAKYGDIVQFDIADTYLNLTIIQLNSYQWVLSHCPSMRYYVRADADMQLTLETIADDIVPSLPQSFAYGHVFRNARVFRNPDHKYYMPYSVYANDTWPPYISGCMCVMSRDVLETIVKGSEMVRPIHYIDDTYYGQIFEAFNVTIIDDTKWIEVNQQPMSKVLNTTSAAIHRYSPVDLLALAALK